VILKSTISKLYRASARRAHARKTRPKTVKKPRSKSQQREDLFATRKSLWHFRKKKKPDRVSNLALKFRVWGLKTKTIMYNLCP